MSSVLDRQISEAAFQQQVTHLAKLRGWLVAHFRVAQNSKGRWRTPVAGDGAGFPDLVLVRDRVIFAELKSEKGRTSAAQDEWMSSLLKAGAEAYLWRPRNFPEIEVILK